MSFYFKYFEVLKYRVPDLCRIGKFNVRSVHKETMTRTKAGNVSITAVGVGCDRTLVAPVAML